MWRDEEIDQGFISSQGLIAPAPSPSLLSTALLQAASNAITNCLVPIRAHRGGLHPPMRFTAPVRARHFRSQNESRGAKRADLELISARRGIMWLPPTDEPLPPKLACSAARCRWLGSRGSVVRGREWPRCAPHLSSLHISLAELPTASPQPSAHGGTTLGRMSRIPQSPPLSFSLTGKFIREPDRRGDKKEEIIVVAHQFGCVSVGVCVCARLKERERGKKERFEYTRERERARAHASPRKWHTTATYRLVAPAWWPKAECRIDCFPMTASVVFVQGAWTQSACACVIIYNLMHIYQLQYI